MASHFSLSSLRNAVQSTMSAGLICRYLVWFLKLCTCFQFSHWLVDDWWWSFQVHVLFSISSSVYSIWLWYFSVFLIYDDTVCPCLMLSACSLSLAADHDDLWIGPIKYHAAFILLHPASYYHTLQFHSTEFSNILQQYLCFMHIF